VATRQLLAQREAWEIVVFEDRATAPVSFGAQVLA